jgi:formylglycine-generating enzyme required for sulfatase activity
MRTGRLLFPGMSTARLMQCHLNDSPDMAALGEAEQKVLSRALSKDPEERFPTCMDFVRELHMSLPPDARLATIGPGSPTATSSAIATGAPAGASTATPIRRRSWGAGIGAVAAVVGVAALALILYLARNPPSREPKLPAVPAGQFRPVAGSEIVSFVVGGQTRTRFKHIEIPVGDKPVKFVLIPGEGDGSRPYYMMVDKVWNSLFQKFADEFPEQVTWPRWRLGARISRSLAFGVEPEEHAWHSCQGIDALTRSLTFYWFVSDPYSLPHPGDLGVSQGDLPVLRVELEDAHRFAKWLGGVLPSVEQWDRAAGKYEKDRGIGPFQGTWDLSEEGAIGIGRGDKGPLAVGQAAKDKSLMGCNDMAGNGLEWTRTLTEDLTQAEYKGDAKVSLVAYVILRGRRYSAVDPLRFEDLSGEGLVLMPFHEPRRSPEFGIGKSLLPEIGFRVVLMDF